MTNAATVWTLLCVSADVHVSEITHIPGQDNDKCDQLSRRGSAPTSSLTEHAVALGLKDVPPISLQDDTDVATLLGLCRPTIPIDTDTDFVTFWKSAQSSIDQFLERHQKRLPIPSLLSHRSSTPPIPSPTTETDTYPVPFR